MDDEQETKLEDLSIFLGAVLIIFLQFGFSMLQIGGVQYRRSRKMFIKSVFDMSITGLGRSFSLTLLTSSFKAGGSLGMGLPMEKINISSLDPRR